MNLHENGCRNALFLLIWFLGIMVGASMAASGCHRENEPVKLGFARGGKYEVRPTDINALIQKSATLFGRTKKEIAIHASYPDGVWTVEVDQGQMEQVLMNLFINAWQAMPGGGDLYLETENVVMDENRIRAWGLEPGMPGIHSETVRHESALPQVAGGLGLISEASLHPLRIETEQPPAPWLFGNPYRWSG